MKNENRQSKVRHCHYPPTSFWNGIVISCCVILECKVVLSLPKETKSGKSTVCAGDIIHTNPKYKVMLAFSTWGFSNPNLTFTNMDKWPRATSGPSCPQLAWPGVETRSLIGLGSRLEGYLLAVSTLSLAAANLIEASTQVMHSQQLILSTQISQLYMDLHVIFLL